MAKVGCVINGTVNLMVSGEQPRAIIQAQCTACEWHGPALRYVDVHGYQRAESAAIDHFLNVHAK